MTDQDIKRAREIIETATKGPWVLEFGNTMVRAGDGYCIANTSDPNAQFITAARTGWPAALDCIDGFRGSYNLVTDILIKKQDECSDLITERDQLRAEVERLKDVLLRLGRGCRVRKVHEEWPALDGISRQAIEMGEP